MLNVRLENRVDVLRDACVVLQNEVTRQSELLHQLAQRNAELEGRELTQAELDLIDGAARKAAEKASSKPPNPSRGRRGRASHGPNPQPSLPREVRLFELASEERTCRVCDGKLQEMGVSEDAEEITVVERTYKVVVNRRKKYRCSCNANVVTAPGPQRLIPGGRYSTEFIVAVAVDKYADHLPLERQVARMARQGLSVSSSTLAEQIITLAEFLAPTYEALRERLLEEPVLHVDETGWLLAPNGKPIGKRRHRKKMFTATVWGLCSDRYAHYALLDSKSTDAGRSLIGGYTGYLVADGYQVYKTLSKPPPGKGTGYTLVNCWAHVVRKFRDLEPHDSRATLPLQWIRELYDIDAEIEGPFPGEPEICARRLKRRRDKAPPILQAMREWALDQGGLRRSDFGRALNYMLTHWDNLAIFLEDGRVPLDNNRVERALRRPVIGRKNHFSSRSERGARATVILYSLVETARIHDIDPAEYLLEATNAAIQTPGAVTLLT